MLGAAERGGAEVSATAAWRRSDADPLGKAVFVTAADHAPVACSFVGAPTADAATVSFVPAVRPGAARRPESHCPSPTKAPH